MRFLLKISTLFFLFVIISCDEDSPTPEKEGLVIEGYLHANNPVTEIKINKLADFGDEQNGEAVNDATVWFISRRIASLLVPTLDRDGFYHLEDNSYRPRALEVCTLAVIYKSDTLISTTRVPIKPQGLTANKRVLRIDTTRISRDQIVFSWDLSSTWSPVVRAIESDPELIPIDIKNENVDNPLQPTESNGVAIGVNNVDHFGDNAFILYHINKEYVDLFSENSSNFFVDNGNVFNGFGIFTSFNSDTLIFNVRKQ